MHTHDPGQPAKTASKAQSPLEEFIVEFNSQNGRLNRNIDRLKAIKQRLINEPEEQNKKEPSAPPDNSGYFPKMRGVMVDYATLNGNLESLLERLDKMI